LIFQKRLRGNGVLLKFGGMSSGNTVSDLKTLPPGNCFSGVFILKKKATRTAKNGSQFLSADFGDRTGTFSCTIFSDSPVIKSLDDVREGEVVHVEGVAANYNDRFSPKIEDIVAISEEEVVRNGWVDTLVEVSPENFDALCEELDAFVDSISHEPLRKTVRATLEESGEVFKNSSAAISMHHAYRHGLLEHSVHLARAARALLPLYPQVNADLVIAGTLLHDIGKTIEYTQGFSTRKTRTGILCGHVVLGYRCVRKQGLKNKLEPEILERLEHIILSHQGELEWGAAAIAATPEAILVSLIDNLDAKMGMVQAALRNKCAGEEFSEFFPGLKTSVLVTPPPFPPPAESGVPVGEHISASENSAENISTETNG